MRNKKGFTLAEMLIVVAIIGILVMLIVPVLTKSLEKSREAADLSNLRGAMSELQSAAIFDDTTMNDGISKSSDGTYFSKTVYATQKTAKWQSYKDDSGNDLDEVEVNKIAASAYPDDKLIDYWVVCYYVSGANEGIYTITPQAVE